MHEHHQEEEPQSDAAKAVRALLGEFAQQICRESDLFRMLAEFDSWQLPLAESEAHRMLSEKTAPPLLLAKDENDRALLRVFTDGDACSQYRSYAKRDGEDQYYVSVPGFWLFSALSPLTECLWVNEGSEPSLSLDAAAIDRLRGLARAVQLERVLTEIRTNPAAPRSLLADVLRYERYVVCIQEGEQGYRLAMAPDEDDRALAAIFTAEDAAQAFLDANIGEGETPPTLRTMSGRELFTSLQDLDIDGFVFNCEGPSVPRAFVKRFAELVLRAH